METTESRFAHLLQPIRELTKNWDIDVASELNDYLEELDEMCITFDGGRTRLNFAEAALLIQGSACIYSKKVELLHSLVYQTLEYINDRNKRRNRAAQQGDADAAAGGTDADDEDGEQFTPLELDASERSQTADSSTAVSVAPLPPESLIPPEAHEKQKFPLISLKGEVLCSQKDFRINVFVPADEDMIVLTFGSTCRLDGLPADRLQPTAPPEAPPTDAPAEDDGGDAADEFLPIDDNMEVEQDPVDPVDPEEHVERQQAVSDGPTVRERRQVEDGEPRRTEPPPPAVNVWTLHDPYAVLGGERPFRAGKCYRVPDGLDDGGKRKRRHGAALQDFRSWFRGTFDPPEHKLKNGPQFTDLNYVYLSSMKERVRSRRRINRKAGVVVSEEELRRTLLQPEEAGPQQQGEEPVDGFRGADLLGGDESDNEHEAFPDDVPAELLGAPDFISPDAQRDELSYEDLVKLRVEQLVVTSRGYTQETALSQRVRDWEDQIRPELLLQEQRPVFDIHDYGDRIVGALSAVGQRRSFASIVAGLDNFEACKYLLASLQLANDYTVDIDSAGGLEAAVDSMGLTLLSTHRATDRFKTLPAATETT